MVTDTFMETERYSAGVEIAGLSEPHPLAASIADMATRYVEKEKRGAVRRGMGDAAHLCDALAFRISRTGRKSKRRDELAAVAKACGDAIWAMREMVSMSDPTPPHGEEV